MLGIILLILTSGIIVFFTAENYVNKNLTEWVARKSDNLYRLKFEDVQLDFQTLSISVSNIYLSPDPEVSEKVLLKNPEKTIYSFHSPRIEINQIKLAALIKNKSFRCKYINVFNPEIELKGTEILQTDSVQTFDKLFYEIQPLFLNTLKNIVIDEINFIDANYKIYSSAVRFKQISNAENISLVIRNFRTDSALIYNEKRFFDSEDILIKMNKFRNDLGDSLHILSIDTLEYSLKTSNILANGFHLNFTKRNKDKNLYEVFVPQVRLKSKSITRFSIGDSIDIQYLEFRNPEMRFYNKENPRKLNIEDIGQFDLYPLIKTQFTYFKVDSFDLINAKLEIFHQPEYEQFQQNFKSLNVSLFGFMLNPTSSQDEQRLMHALELEMNVQDYQLRLEDNFHEFNAGAISVSTLTNSLRTNNIRITPLIINQEKPHSQVNIACKELYIADVNLKRLYHTRTLPTKSISATEPSVQITYFAGIEKSKKQKEGGLFFELVSAYLTGVYSEKVKVENGTLKIENFNNDKIQGYFETQFNFDLSGFELDSASMKRTDKFFYASNFDLQFFNYQMRLIDNLHRIEADRISILSSDNVLQVQNLNLEPVIRNPDEKTMQNFNRSELYKISIPEIALVNVNLREAFFHNKLKMDEFRITNPAIYFENFGTLRQKKEQKEFEEFYQLIFTYLSDFDIREIIIPNGDFTWINHTKNGKTISFDNEFAATLENFRLNKNELQKKRLLFSDNFNVSLKDQVFMLSDSVHILEAADINLSTKKSQVTINNAFLYPDINSSNYNRLPTTFQVSFPSLQLSKIDFLKAYFSKELFLDKLELKNPKFRIFTRSGVVKSLDLKKFQFPLPSLINSLQINELNINNGQVITYEIDGKKQTAQSNFNIDLTLPLVTLKNSENNFAKISTNNFIAKITNFSTPLGKTHELKLKELDYNRQQKSIQVNQLNVIPFVQKNQGNTFSIAAPHLSFTGFEINAAIENNHFIFDNILISNPEISIEITDSIKGDKLEFTRNLNLYPFIEPYVDKVAINRLRLNNVDLNFNWFTKEVVDRRFNIDFREINIEENQLSENLLHAKEFEISTANFSTTSKNRLYEFTADSLIYNSEKHNVILTDIEVNPLLPVEQFNKRSIFQTDYVKAKTNFIELSGVDESLWLREKIIDANKLVIGKTSLNVFRNKRYPFNENQRPSWPQDLLKNIKQPFVFDSVILQPSEIIYSELSDITEQHGSIGFYDLQLHGGQLSNIENKIEQRPHFKALAKTKVMNISELSVQFDFDLSSETYTHSVSGNLQPLQMKLLNIIVEKTSPLSIESGHIDEFKFDLDLNNNYSTGEIYFAYQDLKINIMNLESDEVKKSKLATFWANNMIFNKKNPKGDELFPETISYERDIQRSIISYWWKSILTGSKQSLGIKPEKK